MPEPTPEQWFVARDGNQQGPFSSDDLRRMVAAGQLAPTDMVWKEGLKDWAPASALRGLFPSAQPRLTPATPAAIPQARELNPYAAPSVTVYQDPPSAGTIEYAEYLPRVGAFLLDGLFLGLMGCIPGGIILFVVAAGTAAAGNDPDAQAGIAVLGQVCAQLINIMIGVVYYVLLETSSKQGTWGKQIVGIKVTDLEGNRISVGRAIGRYFAKFLTGCTCGIGLLMPLFTEKKQTLHDMIAGCLALKKT